jgi:hypothetical protein
MQNGQAPELSSVWRLHPKARRIHLSAGKELERLDDRWHVRRPIVEGALIQLVNEATHHFLDLHPSVIGDTGPDGVLNLKAQVIITEQWHAFVVPIRPERQRRSR